MFIRKAVVAGYFYPGEKKSLETLVKNLISVTNDLEYQPKAIIVPHAGYIYSGPIAASAYGLLGKFAQNIKRVILVGPSHRVYIQGIGLSSADYFETPLGKIEVDTALRDKISTQPGVVISDDAHQNEHSLEVQLPFLQMILNQDIKILPAVTNMASPFQINHFFEEVWGGDETLIVISSDLSHYMSYDEAKIKDKKTANAILDYNIDNISDDDACGSSALKGFLLTAQKKKLKSKLLDLRNSGDTASDRNKVVGYGAFFFYEFI